MIAAFDTSELETVAFDRGTEAIMRLLSVDQAQQLVSYQGDDALRQRIDELASKCDEGAISPAERAEYEGYVRANKFVALLQSRARKLLARGSA